MTHFCAFLAERALGLFVWPTLSAPRLVLPTIPTPSSVPIDLRTERSRAPSCFSARWIRRYTCHIRKAVLYGEVGSALDQTVHLPH